MASLKPDADPDMPPASGSADGGDDYYADEWMAAPEQLRAQVLADPGQVEATFRSMDNALGHRLHSVLHPQSLTMLIIDPENRSVIAADGVDPAARGQIDWESAATTKRSRTISYSSGTPSDESVDVMRRSIWAFVPASEALLWDLPTNVLDILAEKQRTHVLAITTANEGASPFRRACDAYALTGLERRVVMATLRAGNIRRGAVLADVQYATAREAMAGALAKVGVRRMPGLIYKISMLAFGIFPNSAEATQILADLWGLSPRQSQIALLLAEGLTRSEAARVLGLSDATIKKQIDIVLQTLGLASAGEVAGAISAVTTLQALSDASHGRIAWTDHASDPLRFIRRPDGSRIAISDFGPAGGRPVILTHACFSGRHPPRELTRLMIERGFRPIAIDRPGYGLTDFHPDIVNHPVGEPFGAAAQDMVTVLDALGLAVADVIGRGGAQAALAFGALYPKRCGRVVLISPIPPTKCDVGWRGLFGAYREIYRLRPEIIPHSIRLMSRLMDRKFVANMVRKTLANTPPDLAITSRPGFDEDYFRTMQMYALGKLDGYIHEQRYVISEETDGYAPDAADILVIYGDQDAVMDPQAGRSYWERRLPNAVFEEVPDKGRLLDYDVPGMIVDRLKSPSA